MTAQDKILHVANKLGLTSLKNMQGSTGAVYDVDIENSGEIFSNASRHVQPGVTNITENEFEVNEALLIETIGFYLLRNEDTSNNFQRFYGSNVVILFDLTIGNKVVLKNTPVFGSGQPYTFAITGIIHENIDDIIFNPRHQVFMEGAGILIPPQIQWSLKYNLFNIVTGDTQPFDDGGLPAKLGCYLYGTRVLLNFNTSI